MEILPLAIIKTLLARSLHNGRQYFMVQVNSTISSIVWNFSKKEKKSVS